MYGFYARNSDSDHAQTWSRATSAVGRVSGQLEDTCQGSWRPGVRSAEGHGSGQLEATGQVSRRTHVRSAGERVSGQLEAACQVS